MIQDYFDRLLLLKQSPLFREVPTDDLRVVMEDLVDEAAFAGERLFEAGDPADRMFFVLEGEVAILLPGESESLVQRCGPGECFGEMGLLDDQPRSAAAQALTDVRLLYLAKEKLRGLILGHPHLALGLLRGLSLRLREANQWIMEKK